MKDRRILAIDYGMKRIGLALSDPLITFAFPFTTIHNDSSRITKLAAIIKEKSVFRIVLGYPSSDSQKQSGLHREILKFAKELESTFKLEIIFWDETFTSVIAKTKVIESVTSKKKRRDKSLLDQHSAAVILQEYIDSINSIQF